jgi:hypothetical protein
MDLSERVLQILRVLHRPALAERKEQVPFAVPGESGSEMDAARNVQLGR